MLADALHTSRETGPKLQELGLDYVLQVKANQPRILESLSEYMWVSGSELRDLDCGHGRIELRTVSLTPEIDSSIPEPWLGFPGVRFAASILREAKYKKDGRQRKPGTTYYITNLPPDLATRENIPWLTRRHWGAVENGIHHVRDVALREDHSRVRTGALARIMAALANLAISILRLMKVSNIKRTMRKLSLLKAATGVMDLLLP